MAGVLHGVDERLQQGALVRVGPEAAPGAARVQVGASAPGEQQHVAADDVDGVRADEGGGGMLVLEGQVEGAVVPVAVDDGRQAHALWQGVHLQHGGVGVVQGCIRKEGTSEEASGAVRWAVGGGC